MTTVADVKRAHLNADRRSRDITAETLTRASAVARWLKEIMILEAAIRRYALEHGVTYTEVPR